MTENPLKCTHCGEYYPQLEPKDVRLIEEYCPVKIYGRKLI